MAITQDQLEGLSKQVFITDYLLNGLFPCQSDVVRLIRNKKREWKFNDKFEYRMLLATTNTGGSLNSQVFKENVGLVKPGSLAYGVYQATYGSVSDGFDVDMMLNLETKDKKAAFESDFATRFHSLRVNVAALFKNFAIHGKYGVVHQIRGSIGAPNASGGYMPVANVHTPTLGVPFTIKTPINVFNSNFKAGKYLIKTKEPAPWGAADVAELYLVLDNQPNRLSLLPVGTAVSAWQDGEFLEVAQNREIAANSNGISVFRYKMIGFVIASFIGGIGGALYAPLIGFVKPDLASFNNSVNHLIYVVLGGMGSVTGSIISAFVLTVLQEFLRFLRDYRLLIYPLILICMMLFRPQGLLGTNELCFFKIPDYFKSIGRWFSKKFCKKSEKN